MTEEQFNSLLTQTKEQNSLLFKCLVSLENILMYLKPSGELITGQTVTVTAGTPVQLVTGITPARRVIVQAFNQNSDNVAVGRQGVSVVANGSATLTDKGRILKPGQSEIFHITDASLLWLDSVVSKEGVTYAIEKDYN